VDLWQYYDRVENLILTLRTSGHSAEAASVEIAISGGATSGEILGRLSLALPSAANSAPDLRGEIEMLAQWARDALKRPR
jgi:hypothetical protein